MAKWAKWVRLTKFSMVRLLKDKSIPIGDVLVMCWHKFLVYQYTSIGGSTRTHHKPIYQVSSTFGF